MKTIISAHRKWLALALFVLAAGLCYSCGTNREPEAVLLTLDQDVSSGALPDTGEYDSSGSGDAEHGRDGSPAVSSAEIPASEQNGSQGGEPEQDRVCYVHVCGEVVRPGVYRLTEGQRVFEAVEQAGGFTDAAADAFLNLAEPVFDGMKVEVPDEEQAAKLLAGREVSGGTDGGGNASGDSGPEAQGSDYGKINLNTATREELMTLRGIGQAKAEDILSYRQQHGGFGRIEEIMEVPGIKDAAFQKIKDDITV